MKITKRLFKRLFKKISEKFKKMNETIAKKMTLNFGTMLTCYIFMFYGLLPLIPFITPYMTQMLYWSNWIQLWSLPLIIVGQNILGRDNERRAAETHEMVKQELNEIKNLLLLEQRQSEHLKQQSEDLKQQSEDLKKIVNEINKFNSNDYY